MRSTANHTFGFARDWPESRCYQLLDSPYQSLPVANQGQVKVGYSAVAVDRDIKNECRYIVAGNHGRFRIVDPYAIHIQLQLDPLLPLPANHKVYAKFLAGRQIVLVGFQGYVLLNTPPLRCAIIIAT